jgi:putative oxidoreductase
MKSQIDSLHIPILTMTFRVVLGIVFIYSSLDKIYYPADFALAVQNYQIVPDILTNLIAIILPWIEFGCGLLLTIGLFRRESAGILAFLIVVFIIAMLSALIRGLDIDCGCYGLDTEISWNRILEDIGLLFMAIYIFTFPGSQFAVDNVFSKKERST